MSSVVNYSVPFEHLTVSRQDFWCVFALHQRSTRVTFERGSRTFFLSESLVRPQASKGLQTWLMSLFAKSLTNSVEVYPITHLVMLTDNQPFLQYCVQSSCKSSTTLVFLRQFHSLCFFWNCRVFWKNACTNRGFVQRSKFFCVLVFNCGSLEVDGTEISADSLPFERIHSHPCI
jgi:hypothetical protein